jgi:hypothetical protein
VSLSDAEYPTDRFGAPWQHNHVGEVFLERGVE